MTIKDVAEYSGVSVSSVSRVLNDHPDVSESVREKVLEAVRVLHYVPNNSARDLSRTKTDAIGLIVRGAGNPFFTPIIRSIEKCILDAGYTMEILQIAAGDDELAAGASLAMAKRLKGIVFLGGNFDYAPEKTEVLRIPFVCCTYTNSFGTLDKKAFSSVSIDDEAEAFRAVKYLTDRGHRKIAILLDSTHDGSISELRFRGYCRALKEAGIPQDETLVEEIDYYDMEAASRGIRELLSRRNDITAVFTIADTMGIAAIKTLHDAGRRVPEDCSVISIDGLDISRYTIPTLTTLEQPKEELAEQAVSLLLRAIEGRGETKHVYLHAELRKGGSVGEYPVEDNNEKEHNKQHNAMYEKEE